MGEIQRSMKNSTGRAPLIHAVFGFFLLLVFCLYGFAVSDSASLLVLSILASIFVVIVCYCVWHVMTDDRRLAVFAGVFVLLGITYCFAFSPLAAPDETYHFYSSYWMSDCLMGQSSILDSSSFPVRSEDVQLVEDHGDGQMNRQSIDNVRSRFSLFSSDSSVKVITDQSFDIGSNPPYIKAASAIGISLARFFGLGAYPLFYLGRLFNFIFAAVLIIISVRITPVAKNGFAAVAMLPMTLHICSTYSYDGGIIGVAFLFLALIMKVLFSEESISLSYKIALFVFGVLLAPLKVVYSTLAFLGLLIPSERLGGQRAAIAYKAGLACSMLVCIVVLRMPSFISISNSSVETVIRDDGVGTYYSLTSILSDPLGSAIMFVRSMFALFDFYWQTLIGWELGALQLSISAPLYLLVAYVLLLLISAQRDELDDCVIPSTVRIVSGIAAAISFVGIVMSMWMGWTFTHQTIIQGVQGRYLIPFMPAVLLALRSTHVRFEWDSYKVVLSAGYTLGMCYLMHIMMSALIS